jgi:hypothetical protein
VVTSLQVSQFRSNNQALVDLAQSDLTSFWGALNTNGSPIVVRDALLDFFPELVSSYGDAAALLSADFFDELRDVPPSAERFAAVLSPPVDADQAEASARWALGPLFQSEPDPLMVLSNLFGAAQRLVLQPGRDTVINSASRDPVRTGFARIPVGVTCKFCTMVASRGFVFASAKTAGDSRKWHDDCDCIVVSGKSKSDLPEGYSIADLTRRYQNGEGIPA